jgi:hypothetical protein
MTRTQPGRSGFAITGAGFDPASRSGRFEVAAIAAALEAKPYRKQYTRPMEARVGVNRKRQLNLYDPDGTRIELMEWNTIDGKPTPSSQAPPPR